MKKTLFAALLGMTLAAGSASAAVRFGIGVNFGAPGPVVAARPPMPGAGYVWIDACNGPNGFVPGYWALPPFSGAYWVAPRSDSGRFVAGFWGGMRVPDTHVMDTHTNFRATPLRDNHVQARDNHFNDRNDRFQNNRNEQFQNDRSDRVQSGHDDHTRDFRR